MGHFSRRYAPDAHPVTVYMHHQTIDSSGESLHLCHHTARCHFARLLRQFSLKSARIAELGGTIHSLCGKFADIDPLSVSHPKTRASPHPIIPLRVLFITYLFASLEGVVQGENAAKGRKFLLVIKREMRFHLGRWRCAMQGDIHT